MKRNMDLIREILFEVEKKNSPSGWIDINLTGYSREQISYHVKILTEAGYLEARDLATNDGFDWRPISITWQGHEFLDAARDNTIWNKAKKYLGSKVSSVSFDVLKTLLISYVKQQL